ncbi:hypothetical protein IH992_03725 [Candidatus Poribacteria bacterium]|nr:hypothetical protein [Candidatus Poribacteria bacterium]
MHEFEKKEIVKRKELDTIRGWEFLVYGGAWAIMNVLTLAGLFVRMHLPNKGVGVLSPLWEQTLPIVTIVMAMIAVLGFLSMPYRIIRAGNRHQKAERWQESNLQGKASSLPSQT